MQTPEQIRDTAFERLEDAKMLSETGRWHGAFYLAGYALELMLKYKICVRFGTPNLFDEDVPAALAVEGVGNVRRSVKIHDLHSLLIYSGLRPNFHVKWLNVEGREFFLLRGFLSKWDESCRYKPEGFVDKDDVIDIIELFQKKGGLLQWIEEQ